MLQIKRTLWFQTNYMQEAIDRGWYNPASGKPFIWQDAYTPLPEEYATSRFWLFYQTFTPNLKKWPNRFLDPSNPYKGMEPYFQVVEPLSLYPFSATPRTKYLCSGFGSFSTFHIRRHHL